LASFQNCAAKTNSTATHTKDFCEKNAGTLPDFEDFFRNRQKKKAEYLNFLFSSLTCSQIGLIPLVDDHRCVAT
jgi:hypothetical protein